MHNLSLKHKIGQMIIIGFRGLSLQGSGAFAEQFRTFQPGGVIFYDTDVTNPQLPHRNIQSVEQVRRLCSELQSQSKSPLLISIDQEGGQVQRVTEQYGFPTTPSWASVGKNNDSEHTRLFAKTLAKTLHNVGINFNLAPVVDVNTNVNGFLSMKDRCVSHDVELVTQHSKLFIEEHRRENVICTLKHFPGLGSAAGDTHEGLVNVTNTWNPSEMYPYEKLINDQLADVIMVGHCFHQKYDSDWPASMSYKIIQKLLRDELKFTGVVICDDPSMGAIANHYPLDVALEKIINAGCDLLCFGNNLTFDPDLLPAVVSRIEQLVTTGRISQNRIDEANQRIRKLKQSYL